MNLSKRGGVHSKFNCPIRNEDTNQQQANDISTNNNNNLDMSNLKHIDQKLIEIIQSEVTLF